MDSKPKNNLVMASTLTTDQLKSEDVRESNATFQRLNSGSDDDSSHETVEMAVLGGGEVRAGECVCCGSVFCYYCVQACSIPFVTFARQFFVQCVCSPFCFTPLRPSWNRSFSTATDALRVTARKVYMRESDVRVVRLIDHTPIPKWLAPRTDLHVTSKYLQSIGPDHLSCELFYPQKNADGGINMFILEDSLRRPTQLNDQDVFVLYLHGGGFVFTHSGHFRDSLHRLVGATGAHVIAPNFSRPPEAKYPTPVDECRDVYVWMTSKIADPSKQIVFAGDSAGGGLVISVLESVRDHNLPMPAGAVLVSPWVDYDDPCTGKSMRDNVNYDYITPDIIRWIGRCYCPKTDDTSALIGSERKKITPSSISPTNLTFESFPPILMFVGECEVLLDQQLAFARKLRDAKVDLKLHIATDMPHVYWLFAFTGMDEPCAVFDDISAFVTRLCPNVARRVATDSDVAATKTDSDAIDISVDPTKVPLN